MKSLASLTLVLSFACTSQTSPTKDRVAANEGKSDDSSELCEQIGAPADCDLCEELEWYGDGVCDDFCDLPDSDCLAIDCADTANKHRACLDVEDNVIGDCVPEVGTSAFDDVLVTCCNGSSTDPTTLCHDLSRAEDCDLEDGWEICVTTAMTIHDIDREQAELFCADDDSEWAICCEEFPGTFVCEIAELVENSDA